MAGLPGRPKTSKQGKKCKRAHCQNETKSGRWYCSKECAPLGKFSGVKDSQIENKNICQKKAK